MLISQPTNYKNPGIHYLTKAAKFNLVVSICCLMSEYLKAKGFGL